MIDNYYIQTNISSPVRYLKSRVELYNGSTLIDTFEYTDRLISYTIERTGESRFYGYTIPHRLNIKLIDTNRQLDIKTNQSLKVYLGTFQQEINPFPMMYVSEVHRDENTNELSITAYDALYSMSKNTIAELTLGETYTIQELAAAVAAFYGLNTIYINLTDSSILDIEYVGGANFDGTETLRDVLMYIAEITNTICYMDREENIVFKQLDNSSNAPVYKIDKYDYFTLDSKTNRRLGIIYYTTELGDNLSASITESGTAQYIRDNPLINMREDAAQILDKAIAAMGGLTINQFECSWRGNFLLELGDKIGLQQKDLTTAVSYLLDDVIEYNGGMTQRTRWAYEDTDEETASNPTNLGEALKETYARVDKANKNIDIVASSVAANAESISSLRLDTESITLAVSSLEAATNEVIEGINTDLETINNKVSATMTADDVRLEIATELANGTSKVITSTGFIFDDEGLTVEKSGSEMKTQITEDGMKVFKDNEAVLTANNIGVDAVNLHATTYLIIGTNSRIEDYGYNRTGCFWIGER